MRKIFRQLPEAFFTAVAIFLFVLVVLEIVSPGLTHAVSDPMWALIGRFR